MRHHSAEQKTPAHKWKSSVFVWAPKAGECVLVTKGTLEYHINDTVHVLHEGDSIYLPPKTYHQLYNPTDDDTEAIGVISPAEY